MNKGGKRGRRLWQDWEDDILREYFRESGGPERISSETGRSVGSVYFRAHRLRIRRGTKHFASYVWAHLQDPPPLREDLLDTMKCPRCDSLLRPEMVPSGYGYIIPEALDLVCVAGHRFQIK